MNWDPRLPKCPVSPEDRGQPGDVRAVIEAFEAGALAVHREWLAAHDRGEGPPRGDPEFGEAASDYALSQSPATDGAAVSRPHHSPIEKTGK